MRAGFKPKLNCISKFSGGLLLRVLGGLVTEAEDFFWTPTDVARRKFRIARHERIQNAEGEQRRAARGRMQLIVLHEGAGLSRWKNQAVNGHALISRNIPHEFCQRHDGDLRAARCPGFEARVGRGAHGGIRHLVGADDARVRGGRNIGNITDDQRTRDLLQKFQAIVKTPQTAGVRKPVAITVPEQKIHGDDQRGPGGGDGGNLLLRKRGGIQEHQGGREIP